jgi:hypothetical protein
LYTIGKSDFGHAASQDSEVKLTGALARAAKWKAIVLLDEADVFMQERGANEMFRNEQVSGRCTFPKPKHVLRTISVAAYTGVF